MSGSGARKTEREREIKMPGAPDCGGVPDRCYWRGNPLSSISSQGSCSL